MIHLVVELLGLAAVGYIGLLGSTLGIIPATVRAMQLFVSLAVALMYFESLSPVIEGPLAGIGGRDLDPLPIALLLSFLAIYGVTMGLCQAILPAEIMEPPLEEDGELSRPQQIGGGIMGAVAGILLVGTILIAVSLCPLPASLHIRTTSMFYDLGGFCLRGFSSLAGHYYGGRSLVVFGEPAGSPGEGDVKISSEAWNDLDGDDRCTDADIYFDGDRSGTFSEKQPYVDVDGNGSRHIGLLEKYSVWNWGPGVRVSQVGPPPPPPPPDEQSPDRPGPAARPAASPDDGDAPDAEPGEEPAEEDPAAEPTDDF